MGDGNKTRAGRSLVLALLAAGWGWGCTGEATVQDPPAGGPASSPAAAPATGPRAAAGGIAWAAPEGWSAQGTQGMRAATYTIPAAAAGTGEAEMAVFFFGPGQGGDTEANIQRWIGQFRGPDGGPAQDVRRAASTVGGLKVTTLEATGVYAGAGGPRAGGGAGQPGYAMLAAIVEGPSGPVFFKLTGPVDTVEEARAAFHRLLASVHLEAGV